MFDHQRVGYLLPAGWRRRGACHPRGEDAVKVDFRAATACRRDRLPVEQVVAAHCRVRPLLLLGVSAGARRRAREVLSPSPAG